MLPNGRVKQSELICKHGLTDGVTNVSSITVVNHQRGEKTTIYGYFCADHQKYGNHVVTQPLQP